MVEIFQVTGSPVPVLGFQVPASKFYVPAQGGAVQFSKVCSCLQIFKSRGHCSIILGLFLSTSLPVCLQYSTCSLHPFQVMTLLAPASPMSCSSISGHSSTGFCTTSVVAPPEVYGAWSDPQFLSSLGVLILRTRTGSQLPVSLVFKST